MAVFEKALWDAQGGRCFNCNKRLAQMRANGTLGKGVNREHVVARSLGGAEGYPNLALSHVACNAEKDNQPATADQLTRLAAINSRLSREALVEAAAEEIRLLRSTGLGNRLPGAGRMRARAVGFLASTLPELNREEMAQAFRAAGAHVPDSSHVNGVALAAPPPAPGQAAPPMAPAPAPSQEVWRFPPPDPLDMPSSGPAYEAPLRPRPMLTLLALAGLAASIIAALGVLRLAPAWGEDLVRPVVLAPLFLAGALAAAVFARRQGALYASATLLLLAATACALAATQIDPQAHAIFNDLMAGNGLDFRLNGGQSALVLAGLALGALAWLNAAFAALTARAPID